MTEDLSEMRYRNVKEEKAMISCGPNGVPNQRLVWPMYADHGPEGDLGAVPAQPGRHSRHDLSGLQG